MPQLDVLGLGVSTIDIVTLVDHLPAGEEIQRAHGMTVQGGGPVATAIVALARLGARVAMIDALGNDWRGKLILEEFQRESVATEHIKVVSDRTSATACVLVQQSTGSRAIVYLPGTVPELSTDDLPRSAIETARILHINGRHGDACLQACRWARQADVRVSFDGGANRYRPEMIPLLALTDICIVARDFAEKCTQEQDLSAAAARLLEQGPSLVVITDGTRGSWIHPKEGRSFHQPAYQVPAVVDTTGCGDAYHGAFLFGLLQGWPLERAASTASAAAAINAQHLGGRQGLPDLEAVEDFLARHREI